MQRRHRPVLLEESLSILNIRRGGVYLDATLGEGGHARRILEACAPEGVLIGMDRDPEAVARVSRELAGEGSRVHLVRGNYRDMSRLVRGSGFEAVDGVLMDLGLSMAQVTSPSRGMSFLIDAPLDMRMDPSEPVPTAYDLVNRWDGSDLGRILRDYGEEKGWRAVVRAILRARERGPLRTTGELARVVEQALGGARRYRIHPATRTFQALRIAVNDELNALEQGLREAVGLLRGGGRIVVIAFHSLEDRMVKRFFRDMEKGCTCPADFPACACGRRPVLRRVLGKPLRASAEEVGANPSARSARLRAAEKREEGP